MRGFLITESEKNKIRSLYKNKGLIKEQNETTTASTECIPVQVIGTFPVMVTENDNNVETFMTTLLAEIGKNEKLKKGYDEGKLYITKINLMGGASNVLGSKTVKPTMDNNYNPTTYPDNAKYKGDFNANMQLAEDRAKNLWTALQTKLPENKIEINGVTPTFEKYIINTFGKNDTTNASAIKAGTVKPGQIVKVTLDVCVEGGGTDILKCFESAIIEVSYDSKSKDQAHVCNNAVYQIYANGIPLKSISGHDYASLNNKDNPNLYPSDKSDGKNVKGGTYEFNYFKLDIDGDNKQFFNQEFIYKYDGGLVVSAKCLKTEYGKWAGGPTDCHNWVGDIKLQTTSGVEVVNVGKSDLPGTGLQFSTPNTFEEYANVAGFEACKKQKT